MRIVAISFASPQFYNAQNNLAQSMKGNGITGYISYTPEMISDDFKERNSKIWNQSRGFGYWCWKPYIILETMKLLRDGDIVMYLDSCNIITNPLNIIIDKCVEDEIVLFENRDGNSLNECWRNSEWTKRDCFTLMELDTPEYWYGKQVNASYQLFKKSPKALLFLEEYLKYCQNENILTDCPNVTGDNFPEFKDHRHDQSVASLLAIKYNVELLGDPSEWGNLDIDRTFPQLFWHCRGYL